MLMPRPPGKVWRDTFWLATSVFMTPKASSLFTYFNRRQETSGILDFLQNMSEPPSRRARALQTRGLNLRGQLEVPSLGDEGSPPNTVFEITSKIGPNLFNRFIQNWSFEFENFKNIRKFCNKNL
jgi:hypothetical protein